MTAFFFALVASFLAATGARDQLLVAGLRARLGPAPGLLVVALASAVATAFLASWFGAQLSQGMSRDASTMFVALAMLLAAFECIWPNRTPRPQEPTRSLGAIAIVLFLRQLTDASRFLVAAFAVALASPTLAGLGGSIGGGAAVAIGWAAGDALESKVPLRKLRLGLGLILAVLAVWVGLTARGLIG